MYLGTHAWTHPDKLAAILPATGDRGTYAQLDVGTNQFAHLLRDHALIPGDHVSRLEFLDIMWVGARAGLYVTPVSRYLPTAEATVDNCDAKAPIVSAALPESAELGRQLTPRTVDFNDAVQRPPTGKLNKKGLRDQYWGAAAVKIDDGQTGR